MKRLRWFIATQLGKLRGQCWTDLVLWANHGREDGAPVLPLRPITWGCELDAAANGACPCGRLTADGKSKP